MTSQIDVFGLLSRVREKRPLVHHITNWVTIYDCANVVRTMGALPVMAHAAPEVAEMVGISSALVLNIGTLTPQVVESMKLAANAANKKGIPIVLDAVGAGATKYRTDTCNELLNEYKIAVVKGNAGEIGVLAGAKAEVRGVESMGVQGDKAEIARNFAKAGKFTVAMTGKQDVVAGKSGEVFLVDNGSEWMGRIVGTGCMAASVIGAFVAVENDHAVAAASALSAYGIGGELAGKNPKGPGTFKALFFDELYNLDEAKITKMAKITSV
ncbi:MAG: hydroxyethylthiazole kinase [Candidatus Micrarchaeia archaeon]|jgi:hydroxyethylthiazole kinase